MGETFSRQIRNWTDPTDVFGETEYEFGLPNEEPFETTLSLIGPIEDEEEQITVVIPTLNEARNIEAVVADIRNQGLSNILVIDGNSHDRTAEIAKEMGVNVVDQLGKGKGSAIREAFGYDGLSHWVIMIDADGSMSPAEIPVLIEPLRNGADVVKGSRFIKGGSSEDMTFIRRIGNLIFISLVNVLFGAKYTDLCYGYAAFTKEALCKLQPHLKSKGFEIETEMFIKAKKLGLKIVEVPSIEYSRRNGQSNLNAVRDGFKILKTIMREAYSKIDYNN